MKQLVAATGSCTLQITTHCKRIRIKHMAFLEQIFASLERSGDAVVLQELRDGQAVPLTARQLLAQVQVARAYLRRLRLKKVTGARAGA